MNPEAPCLVVSVITAQHRAWLRVWPGSGPVEHKGGREGGRKEGREEGRKERREAGREGGREGGRKEGRKEGRKGKTSTEIISKKRKQMKKVPLEGKMVCLEVEFVSNHHCL